MTSFTMTRFAGLLLVAIIAACSKSEVAYRSFPLEEHALSIAASKCQNPVEMGWLRDIIKLAEEDLQYKGSIYAIQYSHGTAFLLQPWISSCFACHLYNCEGEALTASESEKTEIVAGAKEENVIYTSSR